MLARSPGWPTIARHSGRAPAAVFFLLGLQLVPAAASAVESEVKATSTVQSYTLRSPFGEPQLRRRRFTQLLGLRLRNLDGLPAEKGPEISFAANLRLDGDFGQTGAERDPRDAEHFVPGLEAAPLDVMFAYLDARGLVDQSIGLRLGRQYITDALGWWSFDGALLRVGALRYVELETYAGLEQRGALPLVSTSRFEADGVYRGDRTGLDRTGWPGFLDEARPAPAWGIAAETAPLDWLDARVSYRRVTERDTVVLSPFPRPDGSLRVFSKNRTSSERFGVATELWAPSLGRFGGGAVYDLYRQRWSELRGGLEWAIASSLLVGLDGELVLPTFDADSIFNFFAQRPMRQCLARLDWQASRHVRLYASSGVRVFGQEDEPSGADPAAAEPPATAVDGIGSLTTSTRWGPSSVTLSTSAEVGQTGHLVGGDLRLTRSFAAGLYDVLTMLFVYSWSDEIRRDRSAASLTYVLGAGVSPLDTARLGIEWEQSMNRLTGERIRLLGTLQVRVQ
ncbi:MAG: hypothetical protein JW940_07405 [Polyangiaceae bacterium]|nr:hypothetical protein [Polyangiaceae bacterium]